MITERALALFSVLLVGALGELPVAGVRVGPRAPSVVDLHVDLSYRVNYRNGSFSNGSGQYVASRLERAGVAGVVLPLFVPKSVSPEGPRATDFDTSFERLVSLIPRTSPYALPGCKPVAGMVRTWLSFEGAAALALDPDAVPRWTARGARLFGLVHTSDNSLATSSGSAEPSTTGLTDAGRGLVQRIFTAGGVVDVSHASDASTDEIIRLSAAAGRPVVATHSNARTLVPHPRNLTDAQIRAIAATGGVVGVNFHSRFLVKQGRARLSDVVRHIEYLVKVAGVDHVAIGSDFEGDITPPAELASAAGFPRLAAALEAAGMPPDGIAKVFGTNALRILCPSDVPRVKK